MIEEIYEKLHKFTVTFGGSPDTLCMTKEMMLKLDAELCENLGTVENGVVFMGMSVVETVNAPLFVGVIL